MHIIYNTSFRNAGAYCARLEYVPDWPGTRSQRASLDFLGIFDSSGREHEELFAYYLERSLLAR
jgi:hypothetical protein